MAEARALPHEFKHPIYKKIRGKIEVNDPNERRFIARSICTYITETMSQNSRSEYKVGRTTLASELFSIETLPDWILLIAQYMSGRQLINTALHLLAYSGLTKEGLRNHNAVQLLIACARYELETAKLPLDHRQQFDTELTKRNVNLDSLKTFQPYIERGLVGEDGHPLLIEEVFIQHLMYLDEIAVQLQSRQDASLMRFKVVEQYEHAQEVDFRTWVPAPENKMNATHAFRLKLLLGKELSKIEHMELIRQASILLVNSLGNIPEVNKRADIFYRANGKTPFTSIFDLLYLLRSHVTANNVIRALVYITRFLNNSSHDTLNLSNTYALIFTAIIVAKKVIMKPKDQSDPNAMNPLMETYCELQCDSDPIISAFDHHTQMDEANKLFLQLASHPEAQTVEAIKSSMKLESDRDTQMNRVKKLFFQLEKEFRKKIRDIHVERNESAAFLKLLDEAVYKFTGLPISCERVVGLDAMEHKINKEVREEIEKIVSATKGSGISSLEFQLPTPGMQSAPLLATEVRVEPEQTLVRAASCLSKRKLSISRTLYDEINDKAKRQRGGATECKEFNTALLSDMHDTEFTLKA